jgi:iron complex outermembrane recepter protein
MQIKKTKIANLIGLMTLSALTAVTYSQTVTAQQSTSVSTPPKTEKIEVTGSNIKRVDTETPSVVQIITREEIERSGSTTVAELLRNVPAIAGGSLQDFNTGSGFSAAAQSASLRGLGSVGTLVLLNGRRVSPSPTADPNTGQGSAFNLNTIPFSAIERIEILKDGASAIYGSDAIAGVINFILRKDYQGAEVRVSGQSTTSNTFKNFTVSGTAGFGDLAKDRYNVLVSGEYFKRDAVSYDEPNGVLNDDYRRLANRNAPNISSFTQVPNYFREATLGSGVFLTALPTDPRCPAAQVISPNAGCRINTFQFQQIQGKAERIGGLVKVTRDFSGTLQGTAEFSFTRAINNFENSPPALDGTLNGSIWFNRAGQRFQYQLRLPVGHPDNPFSTPVALRYRFIDLGVAKQETTNDAYRGVVGLSGAIGGWDWESALLYSKTERKDVANGVLSLPALRAAIDNRTYRFGGVNSPAVLATLAPNRFSQGATDITSIDLKGSRDLFSLPGGAAIIAAGVEFRRESFDISSDPDQVAGNFIGIASTTVAASRTVKSFFAELSAPLLKNLETQIAVRVDNYSDYNTSTTPKIGVKWKPLSSLAFRANYAEAFRAPSLTQTSNSRVQSFSVVTDPVRCPNGTTPLPGGLATDCTGTTVASIFLPSTNLEPERSKSYTVGFIYSPRNNISLQADLFEIRRRDQIDRLSAQQVVNNEFTPNYIGGTLVRNTNPASFIPGVPNSGPLETTTRRFLNLGETRVKGVDLQFDASTSIGGGRLSLNALATWTIRYDYQLVKGGTFVNNAGNFYIFEVPKLRGNATANYAIGDWSGFARLNYTAGWDYGDPTVANGCYLSPTSPTLAYLGRCQVRALKTIDVGLTYRGVKNLALSLIVRNIENRKAPYDPLQTTLGFNPTFHNPLGSNVTLSANYRFK